MVIGNEMGLTWSPQFSAIQKKFTQFEKEMEFTGFHGKHNFLCQKLRNTEKKHKNKAKTNKINWKINWKSDQTCFSCHVFFCFFLQFIIALSCFVHLIEDHRIWSGEQNWHVRKRKTGDFSLTLSRTCLAVPLPERFSHAIDDDDIDAALAVTVHQITLIKPCCTVEINIIDTRSSTKNSTTY